MESDDEARIADGAAAMTAYGNLQFSEADGVEREKIRAGLLQYCELDTLAMVVIWKRLESLSKKP